MPQFHRILMVEQAAEYLRREIHAGKLQGQLPGVRVLASALGVSPPTISAAVRKLVAEGLLIHEGPRKRLRIAGSEAPGRGGEAAFRKVLFLTPTSLKDTMPVALEILSRLLMARPQWTVRHFPLASGSRKPSRHRWEGLMEIEQPEQVIVFSGQLEQARWAAKGKIPVIFLGGDPGPERIPILGVQASEMLAIALDHLLDLGHRRMCLPFCGHPAGLVERQREVFAAKLGKRDVPFVPAYHTPAARDESPARLEELVRRVFDIRPPTALLALDWPHLLFLKGFAAKNGLRIPEQASIVLLSNDINISWLTPRPAHFRYPVKRLVNTLVRWIEKGAPSQDARSALPLTFEPAEGLAPALVDG